MRPAALLALVAFAAGCSAADEATENGSTSSIDELTSVAAVALPGRVEAEAYRTGGEGVAYHDTTAGNTGGQYRTDDVDIEASAGGGYDVGWIAAGEWLTYAVTIATAGTYRLSVRAASAFADTKSMHFELDGQPLAGGAASLTGGDGWQSWHEASTADVELPSGSHVLKLVFDSSKLNVDRVDVTAARMPIVMGMYDNTAVPPAPEGSTPTNYRAVANTYLTGAKMKVDRVFNSGLPSSYAQSAGAGDPASGNVSFLSVKPPNGDVAGVTAGHYDAAIRSLAGSIPAGSYFTMYHEPEDNMSGSTFVAMFRHFYSVAKAANPELTIGYVAMAYQWRSGSASTQNEDSWYPGDAYTDFLGVDAYISDWTPHVALDQQADFQRWYTWAQPKGKPIVLAEYGIEIAPSSGLTDAVRADIIRRSVAWAWTQPQIKMLLYWNGTSATPGGRNHYINPTTSDPTDKPEARAAWNAMVAQYGSSRTSW